MLDKLAPSYKSLFSTPAPEYEQLLENIPSALMIGYATAINNCIGHRRHTTQQELLSLLMSRFNERQAIQIHHALDHFVRRNNLHEPVFFSKKYLQEFVLREIKRNKILPLDTPSPDEEYNFFIAYLIVADEVSERDNLTTHGKVVPPASDDILPGLWALLINNLEHNHVPEISFEYYKFICLLKYLYDTFRPYLKEYLNQNGFKTIAEYLRLYHTIAFAQARSDSNLIVNNLINFDLSNYNATFVESFTINDKATKESDVQDFKKYPLYKDSEGMHWVIDKSAFNKKMYRGLFFDLYRQTSLKDNPTLKSFGDYASLIAKEVLEKICFQGCIKMLTKPHDFVAFDDNSQSLPDTYYRHKKKVLFIEFKAYLFPDELPKNPDYKAIKKYLDNRFVNNDRGKDKGIGQLKKQIQALINGEYKFDDKIDMNKRIEIYPIICHNDFNFGLPGVAEYLDKYLHENFPVKENIIIKETVVTNLENLFSLFLHDYKMDRLIEIIEMYYKYKHGGKKQLRKIFHYDTFLKSHASFDEYYSMYNLTIDKSSRKTNVAAIYEISGLTDKISQEIL